MSSHGHSGAGPTKPPRNALISENGNCNASLQNVMKCNIYCTSARHFPVVNAIYARYFPEDPPARIFVCVPEWPGPFDIEIDCVAVI